MTFARVSKAQLSNIDTAKASGCDDISPKLLHEAGNSIIKPLTKLFNMCILKNKVPDIWKKANVIPIFKKGDKTIADNYRPISILPAISKVFERIIFKHVYNYIHQNNLLTKHQSGFKPKDSTVNQLSYLYHTFSEALDNKKDIRIVFCDISKAFDRAWHKGILFKLEKMGISGNTLALFKDYLTGRLQRVTIKGQSSEWGHIEAGVPQGSVLGPLLFLIYINDIVEEIDCDIKIFADDTILYISSNDDQMSADVLNTNLKKITKWSNQWLVNFNPQKTKMLNVTNKKDTNQNKQPIFFSEVEIPTVNEHKHLGIWFDSKLKWTYHIDQVISSASKMVDVLHKLKYRLDRSTLYTIYVSYIRPKLEYGCILWDDCTQYDKNRLEAIQHRCVRLILPSSAP